MRDHSVVRRDQRPPGEPGTGNGHGAAGGNGFDPEFVLPRGGAEAGGESDLHYYWRLLYGRRWLLIAATLLGLAIAAFHTFRQPRLYVAQATVEFKQALPPGKDLDTYQNWVMYIPQELAKRLLTTKVLAARVVNTMREKGLIEAKPAAAEGPPQSILGAAWKAVAGAVASVTKTAEVMLGPQAKDQKAATESTAADKWEGVDLDTINDYYSHVTVKPVRATSLADIVVTHPDPGMAARIANLHARAFVDMDIETKIASLSDAQGLLGDQLKEVRRKLETSRQALTDYQLEHGILNLPSETGSLTHQSLQKLNMLLTEAQGARIAAEAEYRNAAAMTPEQLAGTLPEEGLQTLRTEILALEAKYRAYSRDYGQNHPDMMALQAQIESAREQLQSAAVQLRARLRAGFKAARVKERNLRKNLEKVSRAASAEDRELVQLSILQRDVKSNEQLYASLLEKAKEVDLNSGAFQWTNVKLVDKAVTPTGPSFPKVRRNLMLGMFLALGAAMFLCLLLDRLDTSIHTPDDIVAVLDLPAFGVIPDFRRLATTPSYGRALVEPEKVAETGRDLVTLLHPASVVSEAYRGVRTNLLFSSPDNPPKSVLITSGQVSEGKTVTVINLAVTLALSGSRVLVVDADMRKPSCHSILRVGREPGLSNVLAGQAELHEAVVQSPFSPKDGASRNGHGVYILPSGRVPPNPAELLGSQAMTRLLETLKEQFDFVLLDSPPVIPVTDAVVMATKADGVLMVVRGGEWGREVVRKALWKLDAVHARVLGGLLNSVDVTRGGYSYYYRYYYGYRSYYGKSYGESYGQPPDPEAT